MCVWCNCELKMQAGWEVAEVCAAPLWAGVAVVKCGPWCPLTSAEGFAVRVGSRNVCSGGLLCPHGLGTLCLKHWVGLQSEAARWCPKLSCYVNQCQSRRSCVTQAGVPNLLSQRREAVDKQGQNYCPVMAQRSFVGVLLCPRCGGTAGAILTCPLEVVKTRLQSSQLALRPLCLPEIQLPGMSVRLMNPTPPSPGVLKLLRWAGQGSVPVSTREVIVWPSRRVWGKRERELSWGSGSHKCYRKFDQSTGTSASH